MSACFTPLLGRMLQSDSAGEDRLTLGLVLTTEAVAL